MWICLSADKFLVFPPLGSASKRALGCFVVTITRTSLKKDFLYCVATERQCPLPLRWQMVLPTPLVPGQWLSPGVEGESSQTQQVMNAGERGVCLLMLSTGSEMVQVPRFPQTPSWILLAPS